MVVVDKRYGGGVSACISFYVEASNRDAFMAVKQVGGGCRQPAHGELARCAPPSLLPQTPEKSNFVPETCGRRAPSPLPPPHTPSPTLPHNVCLQDVLLAFVDCVGRNGAMSTVPP